MVMPFTGCTASGAISASGVSTNARSHMPGCGRVSPGSSITSVAVEQQVEVDNPGITGCGAHPAHVSFDFEQ